MEKMKLIICLILICGLMACEKPSENLNGSGNCCLPPYYFEGEIGDTVLFNPAVFNRELIPGTPQYAYAFRERIFMPSAFTPDSNFLNDNFTAFLDEPIFTNQQQSNDYEMSLTISLGNWRVFQGSDSEDNLIFWDGRCPDKTIRSGIYKAEVNVTKNGGQFKHIIHYFHLLLPDENGNSEKKYACLIFPDQYKQRYGLIFKTFETFK